jgi:hypothetical protein
VKFEAWVPQSDSSLTERVEAVVSIEPKPYHRYELEYHLDIDNRGQKKSFKGLREFTPADAESLVDHLLHSRPRPLYRLKQVRQQSWQLWKPKNDVVALAFDSYKLLPWGLFFLGFWPGAALAWWWGERRPRSVRSSGKPAAEPRHMRRADSWQTVIRGVGNDLDTVRARILTAFAEPPIDNFRSRTERLWHWSLDGIEERDQIVLTAGRGILFVHAYSYGKDLFLGWDGHLNVGQWVPKRLQRGIDRNAGTLVDIETVVPGTQPVGEYDVIDLICLMEWTHAQIVGIVEAFVEERKIDQEIDFEILRESRQNLTRAEEPTVTDAIGQARRTLASKFRRTA